MLANPIHEDRQRERFIQALLPLTHIPSIQQTINYLGEVLEKSMKIEAMEGYPRILRIMRPPKDANITQLQEHISTLTEKI